MARAFTFIHAADLHLAAPFGGVDATDRRVSDALLDSTYAAFDRIVDLALEREVDLVLVAGDAFNSRERSFTAQRRFIAGCERLAAAGISVYLVHGNHDPADGQSVTLGLPDNVHYFATASVERMEVLDRSTGEPLCALYGRGYATAATRTNLAAGYRRDPGDTTAIGVLHANVGGQAEYEPYAPCTLDDLRAAGMDYWALGHIHKPMELQERPPIRYSGSPQGLNPKESGPHGCWVVTMEGGDVTAQEFVETASVRWASAELDVSAADSVDTLCALMRDCCSGIRAEAGGVPVIARIDIVGRTTVHADLGMGTVFSELVDEMRQEQMAESPWLWLDRVRDLSRAALDIEFLRGVEDFTGDLVRTCDELIADPVQAAALVSDALAGIEGAFGGRPRDDARLLELARDLCLDRLVGGDER